MNIYGEIISTCWVAFFGVWIVASIVGGGGNRRLSPARRVVRLVLVVALAVGIFYGDRLPVPPTLWGFAGDFAADLAAAGSAVCVIGVAFAIWARVTLGRNWGMPMTLHEAPELVTSGPYAYVRHPIYTGLLAMWIGTSLVYPVMAVPAVAMIAYCLFSARREERDMERRFPGAYPEYKRRSKMMVPFLV